MATVSNVKIKKILDTLPIGYYLGTRATIEFSETATTSVCSPITQTIIVAANNVHDAIRSLPDGINVEPFIRAALYHEVSHLILTPKSMEVNNIRNIFEDERIETILGGYFKDVNFKKFVFLLNNWKPDYEPDSAESLFYSIVRFRQGPEELVERVGKIIKKFRSINANTPWCGASPDVVNYCWDIDSLWGDVQAYWREHPHAVRCPRKGRP